MPENYMRFKRKLRDILATSKCEPHVTETETIPLIKQSDTAKLLPKYATILEKNGEEGVSMDDLDALQEDLEKLLNNSACRIRYLLSEVIEFEGSDDDSDRKANDKTSIKRKRLEEKPKSKEQKNGIRFVKKFAEEPNTLQELPEVPRNLTADKFWASVEPFCADIGKDDIVFLDTLIQSLSKEINLTIPELGEHYSKEWEEEVLSEEQNLNRPARKISSAVNEIKKFGVQNIVDTVGNPVTQRLLAALLEEKVMEIVPKGSENGEKKPDLADMPPVSMNNGSTQRLSVCLDNLLKKELIELGVLSTEELEKAVPEDEVVVEVKKCQQELIAMNEYTLQELKKLKELATNDHQANQISEQLDKVDNQILELYHKISTAREAAQKEEGEDFDKVLFSEQITREFESQADALLSRQIELTRQLNGVTDMQMLY